VLSEKKERTRPHLLSTNAPLSSAPHASTSPPQQIDSLYKDLAATLDTFPVNTKRPWVWGS